MPKWPPWEEPEIIEWFEDNDLERQQPCIPLYVCVPRICRPTSCYPYSCAPYLFSQGKG